MAKAKVVHSTDGVTVVFKGDKKNLEPSMAVIKFPGGHVEVSRTSDGKYWAHVHADKARNIKSSRVDYDYAGYEKAMADCIPTVPKIPHEGHIKHMAVLIDGPYVATETL